MKHVEQPPLLIKSATDGQRLRAHIREEREEIRRRVAEVIADAKAALSQADKLLGRPVPPPQSNG